MSTTQSGRIKIWHDDRGFGFIQPDHGSGDVFLHIKAWPAATRPQRGERVQYQLSTSADGKQRATQVRRLSEQGTQRLTQPRPHKPAQRAHRTGHHGWVLLGFALLLAVLFVMGRLSHLMLLGYVGMSVLTFGVYAWDKRAAQQQQWRVPEQQLLVLGLLGGWPGALLAQQTLRHKSSKPEFLRPFWVTVALNLAVLLWLMSQRFLSL